MLILLVAKVSKTTGVIPLIPDPATDRVGNLLGIWRIMPTLRERQQFLLGYIAKQTWEYPAL